MYLCLQVHGFYLFVFHYRYTGFTFAPMKLKMKFYFHENCIGNITFTLHKHDSCTALFCVR